MRIGLPEGHPGYLEPGEARRYSKQPKRDQNAKSPRTEIRGLSIILGRPCGIRTCDQRIKSAWTGRYCTGFVGRSQIVPPGMSFTRQSYRWSATSPANCPNLDGDGQSRTLLNVVPTRERPDGISLCAARESDCAWWRVPTFAHLHTCTPAHRFTMK